MCIEQYMIALSLLRDCLRVQTRSCARWTKAQTAPAAAANPQIICRCLHLKVRDGPVADRLLPIPAPLDVSKDSTFEFVDGIVGELHEQFPEMVSAQAGNSPLLLVADLSVLGRRWPDEMLHGDAAAAVAAALVVAVSLSASSPPQPFNNASLPFGLQLDDHAALAPHAAIPVLVISGRCLTV